MDTLLDRILSAGSDRFITWKSFEPNDLIIGTCIGIGDYTSNGDEFEKIAIKIDATDVVSNGEQLEPGIYLVWQTYMIKKRAEEQGLSVGDRIAIRFDGTPDGKKLKLFTIFIEHIEIEDEEAG